MFRPEGPALNEADIELSFPDEVGNHPESRRILGKAERLAAASKVKAEALARHIAEEEARTLAEVEILAREETEYLTRQLEKERHPDIPPADLETAPSVEIDQVPGEENRPVGFATEDEPFQTPDVVFPEIVTRSAVIDPATDISDKEFAPGEYVLQLRHFETADVMAFHNTLRRIKGLKITATSGAATGIQLHVRLTEGLPLIELLSVAPGVETVEPSGDQILITGRST